MAYGQSSSNVLVKTGERQVSQKTCHGVKETAYLVKCLPCKHKDPGSIPELTFKKVGIVAHTYKQ